jgi:hypothetical protein
MSIAHELSCDVATAILAGREGVEAEPSSTALTNIVLEVHFTLRELTSEARRSRLNSQFFRDSSGRASGGSSNAASGNH